MQAETHKEATQPIPPIEIITGLKYRWKLKVTDEELINNISKTHNLSRPVAHLLFSRGYHDHDQIRSFLFSSFEQDVANPALLKGAIAAADRIIQAMERNEKILIFGDYDVDGITSSGLMMLAMLPLKANINFFLPNRKRDGYGLSSKIVKKAKEHGYSLIITVDNGITAFQPAQDAHDLGIDLIITDHHRPHGQTPIALAIVNPQQEDCTYPFKHFAGVGVIFKLITLIYERLNQTLPDKIYELLMLGTVADVVPLLGENRFWVRHGLAKTNKQRSFAMSVLAQNTGLKKEAINSTDIGFMITPQINALGRLDDPRDGVKFLISSEYPEVERIGCILKKMNEDRKRIERSIYESIEEAIGSKQINLDVENTIIAGHKDWQAGVIGLVAGKLMHNFGRPTLLFHLTDEGIAKGSCRSIPEFNIFNALESCKDLLLSFGGHSFAAGLSLRQEHIPELKQRLELAIATQLTAQDLQPKIELDAHLELPDINNRFMHDLSYLEPFGHKNAQPTFFIKHVTMLGQPQMLKDKHVKCSVFADGVIKPVIFFNRPELFELLTTMGDRPFHLAGQVLKNEWEGITRIELQGLDIAVNL